MPGGKDGDAGACEKERGNELFRAGQFLKAAAAYTKAIKLEPENHIYYSNRSQAFLELSKMQRAFDDADKCLQLKPDFLKGHIRKVRSLAGMERKEEAAAAAVAALQMHPESLELQRLGKELYGKNFTSAGALNGSLKTQPQPAAPVEKKPAAAAPKEILDFAFKCMKDAMESFKKAGELQGNCWMLPHQMEGSELGCVKLDSAFESADSLSESAKLVESEVSKFRATAVCVVAQKKKMSHPPLWKGKAWKRLPLPGGVDGIFIQLEAKAVFHIWFLPFEKDQGTTYKFGDPLELDSQKYNLFRGCTPLFPCN